MFRRQFWKFCLTLAFVWAAYHLVRDIFQDILNVHSPFTEFLHYETQYDVLPPILKLVYIGGDFGRFLTFPIEIFALFAIPKALRNKRFGWLDGILLTVGVWSGIMWLINVAYDPRVAMKRLQLPLEHTFQFRGARMNYRKLGNGKPIILVHGSVINWPQIGEFEKGLAQSYEVYLPDMPGFGASDAINGKRHNTDLFAEALCAFVKETNLREAAVVGWSLGTVTTAKAAANGCLQGKLILVGMPGKVGGWKFELARRTPLEILKWLVATRWGQENLLIPILRENIGSEKGNLEEFFELVSHTDPRSIVEVDYKKEIERDLPLSLNKVKNKMVFIYGENDKLRGTTDSLIGNYITVFGGTHNTFRINPSGTFEVVRNAL